jgi:AhpD family alkylhydroperoxidase
MDSKQMLRELTKTMQQIGEVDKTYLNALSNFIKEGEKAGALSTKVKELISVALSIVAQCEWCIAFHVKNAIDAGATKQEIIEAALVAGIMGGGPAISHIRLVFDACEQFGAK